MRRKTATMNTSSEIDFVQLCSNYKRDELRIALKARGMTVPALKSHAIMKLAVAMQDEQRASILDAAQPATKETANMSTAERAEAIALELLNNKHVRNKDDRTHIAAKVAQVMNKEGLAPDGKKFFTAKSVLSLFEESQIVVNGTTVEEAPNALTGTDDL